jgi:diguanylate cyclase (GGDEF)-like protein
MLFVGGRPAAASAMLIQPSTPGYAVPRGKWPILVSIRYLDRDFLDDLGARQLIANPRFSRRPHHASAETAVPLRSEREGTIGYLIWHPELPGTRVFWKILPVNMAVLALLSLFIVLLGRRLRRASRELTAAEAQAAYLALHDALTGLPNRALFQKTLDGLIAQNSSHNGRFALIMLDVDNFKLTNDTLGHDAGDALLRSFSERLSEAVRPKDLVARLGGDEFALLLDGVDTPEAIEAFASRLLELLRRPCTYGTAMIESQASIGASIGGAEHAAEDIQKRADLALYAAKNAGRGVFRLYSPSMEAGMLDRRNQLSGAKRAMEQDLIRPFYQPQVDLSTGNVLGFEALLRWCTTSGPPHGPQRIAAAFEDSSLGPQLCERIVDLVIKDILTWRSQKLHFGHVAINVAATDLRRPDFASHLYAKLRSARLPTSCIQLEITEQVLLGRASDQVGQTLFDLAGLGIKLAWDDFGTGFASLSHLKNYPVGVIKIDKTFVRDIDVDPENRAIVGAITGLARALDIEVVAEGIETKTQRELLLALDCPVGQGYLFGKAMPAAEASLRLNRCQTGTAVIDPLSHSLHIPAGSSGDSDTSRSLGPRL